MVFELLHYRVPTDILSMYYWYRVRNWAFCPGWVLCKYAPSSMTVFIWLWTCISGQLFETGRRNLMFVDPCIIIFRCNILLSSKIIKELPGLVRSGTPCIIHIENPTRCHSVTKFYFIFIWSSTCFGRHTAHHQEPKTALAASGFACVEGCWTCSCWTLTASTNYMSSNIPRMQNQRLLVQF